MFQNNFVYWSVMQPILKVNLTTREIEVFPIPSEWVREYLGGASLAARILYESITFDLDPLSPNAALLFMNGPLSGTAGPAVGRFVICGKSPATGLWAESNCGGFWGPELRKAGYIGLWITGKAEKPVYLWINDGKVEIRDASGLWGKQTSQTQEAIQLEIGDRKAHIAVIGPAGESQIPFALVLTDHGRVAGRTGMGAVMGSKNLKAVAVRGHGKVPVIGNQFTELRTRSNRELRSDNFSNTTRELGTAAVADYADYLGEMPKKYFQAGTFEGVYNVTGATMAETILSGVSACHACVIACGRVVRLPDEEYKRKGPEYETIVGFGPNLLIDDLSFITRVGELCDQLGMDTISLSNTLGLAFSLYEQGLITDDDTDGMALQWGDKELVEHLVNITAIQEGFGAILAEGARSLGARFGAGEAAVQVNGLEVAYHDPRGASGMALVYATSPRGACHNQSDYFLPDLFGQIEEQLGMAYYERHVGAEKAANVAIHQNWRTVFNSLVMCVFANVPPRTVVDLVNEANGWEFTLETLLQAGERGWNLKRVINNRLGLRRLNDKLPQALLEPYANGGAEGYIIPFEEMLRAYYDARGWDAETGYPTWDKLAELGIEWAQLP
jgi:aldehyde:ferredoxin oxidoreductase